jgi:ribonuclease BN (tRNA processing enzyme)
MKVVIIGSSGGAAGARQYVSSYVINDTVAIDAGCLGFYSTPQEQERIRHVFLTHSHADHIASLPFFLENVWTPTPECPIIYGSHQTLSSLQRYVFNEEIWPDFIALSERMFPFLRIRALEPEIAVEAAGLTLTPIWVNHTVPTFGYVVDDGESTVIFAGDSGATTRLWEVAKTLPRLRAVFLEASFPNRLKGIADASLHLTPEMFRIEAAKVPVGIKIIAVHLKVRYHHEISSELAELRIPCVEVGQCEREYTF